MNAAFPGPLLAATGGDILLRLAPVDYLIIATYFVFVIGIGWVLRKHLRTSKDFFESGRSLPAWICALGFIGANLGAQEVMGMAASGAKYGIATSHFYWIGAIPAMVFVGIFMMPFYYGSKARSVPEYLKLRFDEKTRVFNALTFAGMTVFSSGISMFALAKLLNAILGWNFHGCIIISSTIVLVYIYTGGLTSAIYNEVLQFFLIVFGFLPLVILGLEDIGGWDGLTRQLDVYSQTQGMPGAWSSSWTHMGSAAANPMGVEWFGLVAGLGFVLSFGYWCTDFLVVQRAMAAKDMNAARRTPLIAAIPKMMFPVLVILPGMLAIALFSKGSSGLALPVDVNGVPDYNMVVPAMLAKYFPSGLLGIGLTALMASFMSGMAGNVTAFNTVWTYDLYQGHIKPDASDAHLVRVGRLTTVVGLVISGGCAYLAASFNNIMDMLQLVFGFVNAPLFAIFLLGMFWRRTTGHGAFYGLLIGTLTAVIFHGCTLPVGEPAGIKGGWLTVQQTFASSMAQNFWMAIFAFAGCFAGTLLISLVTAPNRTDDELRGLVYSLTEKPRDDHGAAWYARPVPLGVAVLAATAVLNLIFW
ncbi:Sodium/glucose cotransporter [Lacunisphaera limnophila]|uniref:Sodium/glucose cotransporter n=1 Tax=Lacunisphaera limnophila TaxID=1838286 RepID=A0A1D8AZR9_9BACT|nr:sodium:solute symporter family protein [Lacunisphaera limnophila]AOS46389.1 Sodium/glucose cotransporter [Lacunisphaera limnophila]